MEEYFFDIEGENVIISAVKKAEDGDDVIIRAYEIAGDNTDTFLTTPFEFKSIQSVSLIEVPLQKKIKIVKEIFINFNSNSIETFRLQFRE